jgi:hypothetical protein
METAREITLRTPCPEGAFEEKNIYLALGFVFHNIYLWGSDDIAVIFSSLGKVWPAKLFLKHKVVFCRKWRSKRALRIKPR